MPTYNTSHYKQNYSRYQHYYRQIWRFYQKPSAKVSTALLLTLVTTIFFAVFAIRPTLVTIAELLKTIHDREEILMKLQEKSSSLATAQQEYLVSSDSIEQLNISLPQDKQIQELIQMIEATAAVHQIVIESLSINQFDYSSDETSAEITELPFSIVVTGEYSKIESFILDVLNIPRFTTLEALVLNTDSSDEVDPELNDNSKLELNLRITAFFQPSNIEN